MTRGPMAVVTTTSTVPFDRRMQLGCARHVTRSTATSARAGTTQRSVKTARSSEARTVMERHHTTPSLAPPATLDVAQHDGLPQGRQRIPRRDELVREIAGVASVEDGLGNRRPLQFLGRI